MFDESSYSRSKSRNISINVVYMRKSFCSENQIKHESLSSFFSIQAKTRRRLQRQPPDPKPARRSRPRVRAMRILQTNSPRSRRNSLPGLTNLRTAKGPRIPNKAIRPLRPCGLHGRNLLRHMHLISRTPPTSEHIHHCRDVALRQAWPPNYLLDRGK